MTIPNVESFQAEMNKKLRENRNKRMIPQSTLERHLLQQFSKYFTYGGTRHLVNMANYCAMLWNKRQD